MFGWDEFLRQVSIFILLNRSNYDIKVNQISRSTPSILISHANVTNPIEIEVKRKLATSRNENSRLNYSKELTSNEIFRKHGKILEKLHQKEEERVRQSNFCPIVENVDEDSFLAPKLKVDAKDERQSVTTPWVVVKQMQHLRTQPILITSTRLQMIGV